jgi:hypothetical protein
MRLTDLEPQWLHRNNSHSFTLTQGCEPPLTLSTADGLLFLCPVCATWNAQEFAGRDDLGCPPSHYGTHSIICWQPHVPQDTSPTPGRWTFHGTSFNDLTLTAGSSSIFLTTPNDDVCPRCQRKGASRDTICKFCPCRAHFHITDGEIR